MNKHERSAQISAFESHMGSGRILLSTKEGQYTYDRSQCLIMYSKECIAWNAKWCGVGGSLSFGASGRKRKLISFFMMRVRLSNIKLNLKINFSETHQESPFLLLLQGLFRDKRKADLLQQETSTEGI